MVLRTRGELADVIRRPDLVLVVVVVVVVVVLVLVVVLRDVV